jgi:hypothetical protein
VRISAILPVQHDPAHHLDVEVAHAEGALGGFADGRKGFWQHLVNLAAAGEAMAIFAGLIAQRLVGQSLKRRLQSVDALHSWPQVTHFALVDGAENLLCEVQHVRVLMVKAPLGRGRAREHLVI